ncbi:nicotinamide N-methyltransferase-like [Lissotriton helveticus]
MVKGDTIMQIGMAYLIHFLLPTCESFKEIFVVDTIDSSLEVVKKWLERDPGAIDLSSAAKCFCELKGCRNQWINKEDELRGKITHVVKCDITAKNPLLPEVLPLVDCLYVVHCLESLCPDKETYCCALKNISELLKSGGILVMFVCLNCTFFMIGSNKVPSLQVDEQFVMKTLINTGYVIVEVNVVPRSEKNLHSRTDFSSELYVVAKKV